jgi:hypothetical protein
MAMVEITNENSLYRLWRDGKLKPFSSGGALMVRHARMLDSLWQEFLVVRHGSTAELDDAWNAGVVPVDTSNAIVNAGFDSQAPVPPWYLEQHAPAFAQLTRDPVLPFDGFASAKVIVSQPDGLDWHIQFKQTGLTVQTDTTYLIRFAARSDAARLISVSAMLDSSPWTSYLWSQVLLTASWRVFTLSFRSPATIPLGIRLTFQLGAEAGTYWFDDVTFAQTGATGLLADESLEGRTVRRIDFADCGQYSDPRVADMTAFYIKLQNDYFAEMASYLKDVLGVRVPVVGTNWNAGVPDLAVQSRLEYMDNHSYWDHPWFPGEPWSSSDWLISITPMVTTGGRSRRSSPPSRLKGSRLR